MSAYRQQAMIDAPIEAVWALVADPARYPEWWPRFVEVESPPGMQEGCRFPAVTTSPFGKVVNELCVERLDDCRELDIHCLNTGAHTHWLLTEAQGGTFVDVEFGMEPRTVRDRARRLGGWPVRTSDATPIAAT